MSQCYFYHYFIIESHTIDVMQEKKGEDKRETIAMGHNQFTMKFKMEYESQSSIQTRGLDGSEDWNCPGTSKKLQGKAWKTAGRFLRF